MCSDISSKNRKLLVIAPHLQLFIRDQVLSLSNYLNGITTIIPRPFIPKAMINHSFFTNRYFFLKSAIDSCSNTTFAENQLETICPTYFTLPIRPIQKRGALLMAKKSLQKFNKSNFDFDIIHAHRLDYGYTGALFKDRFGKPLVITAHGSDTYEFPFLDKYRYSISKFVIRKLDHAICVCESDASNLVTLGLSPKRISIIPNGYNENNFKPIETYSAREKLSLPKGKRILLSIGTLWPIKGHRYLIDAIKIITRNRKDVLVVILGRGPLKEQLKDKINKAKLSDFIKVVGWQPHNKIPLWINASDIFVLPSLNEGFPTVIPEVLACGKPVIASNVGGVIDVITNDDIGLLVSPKNSEALAEQINVALNKKWEAQTILTYAQEYSLSNITKQLMQVYATLSTH